MCQDPRTPLPEKSSSEGTPRACHCWGVAAGTRRCPPQEAPWPAACSLAGGDQQAPSGQGQRSRYAGHVCSLRGIGVRPPRHARPEFPGGRAGTVSGRTGSVGLGDRRLQGNGLRVERMIIQMKSAVCSAHGVRAGQGGGSRGQSASCKLGVTGSWLLGRSKNPKKGNSNLAEPFTPSALDQCQRPPELSTLLASVANTGAFINPDCTHSEEIRAPAGGTLQVNLPQVSLR